MHLQVYQTFLQSHYISAAFLVLENMVDIAYVIFAIFRGFTISTTAIMVNRAIKLGGKYWHYLFDLPTGKKWSPHQISEQAILKILKILKLLNFIKSIDILLCDEIGQVSAEFLSSLDIILCRVRHNNIFLDVLLIIGIIDYK